MNLAMDLVAQALLGDGSGGGGTTVEPLSVTANGTYEEAGKSYSPVTVNVSGSGAASPKQVNFYDYDGTLLYSYTDVEFANLDTLPDNPSHAGLTAQGWNWTKAQITEQLTAAPGGDVNVGQMYDTQSGNTEIDIVLSKALSPYIAFAVNGTVNVDWGDGTNEDVTGTSDSAVVRTQHNYSSSGSYTIQIKKVSGKYTLYGGGSSPYYTLLGDNTNANGISTSSITYAGRIVHIRVSSDATVKNYAFRYLPGLETITFPNVPISSGTGLFSYAKSLKYFVIPSGTTVAVKCDNCIFLEGISVPYGCALPSLQGARYVKSMTIPVGCKSLPQDSLRDTAVEKVICPSSVLTAGSYCCNNAMLKEVYATGITSLDSSCLASNTTLKKATVGGTYTSMNYTFNTDPLLEEFTVPSSVTSIAGGTFSSCPSLRVLHMLPTTPPTLTSGAISNNASLVIYVPSASLTAYQTANNWSTYSSLMVGE